MSSFTHAGSATRTSPRESPGYAHARVELFPPGQKKLLLVAATGGHLTQLMRIAERENAHAESLWVTFDSPQSRSLLSDRRTMFVNYVAPRDLRGAVQAHRHLKQMLDPRDFDGALTTGPAVGVAAMAWARRHGLTGIFVESISRTEGPSLSGRIVRSLNLARTYTQHASWSSAKWPATESTLQSYMHAPRAVSADPIRPLRVLVTLGTIRPYRFDRVVDRVQQLLTPADHVVWQLGETAHTDLPGSAHRLLDTDALLDEARNADVVITHSGVGTILQLLDEGIAPVVVPRRKAFGEHVDDHQLQIWRHLKNLGIAFPVEVEDLTRDTLRAAASTRVLRREPS